MVAKVPLCELREKIFRFVMDQPRGAWDKIICGALTDAINAHGDITKDTKSSAAKRVKGLLQAAILQGARELPTGRTGAR